MKHGTENLGSPFPINFQVYYLNCQPCSLQSTPVAKSLQSCPTLCDPIDGSPLGSPVPGILQARTPEWVAISFSNAWKWKVKVRSLSHVRPSATPWTAAYQAPPSMGFSRQEYWSGVPLPSPIYLLIYANLELGVWGRPNFPDTHHVFFFKLISVDSKQFVVVVQSLSYFQLFTTPWTASCQASLPFTTSWSLLKLTFIESLMPSNHLILCQPRLLLPSVFPNIWFSFVFL